MRAILICLMVLAASGAMAQADGLKVMSFNIRYGLADDGDDSWENRKELVAETITRFDPDLLGTQECLDFQAEFLQGQLAGYGFVGVGRDDGKRGGEMCGIFYRQTRFELVDAGHFWLSPTPEVIGSVGWDAALTRMASWVKLRSKGKNPVTFIYCNTHFDHVGKEARRESARIIHQQLGTIAGRLPIILAGDFNAPADLQGDGPYHFLVKTRGWQDSYRLVREPALDEGTFNSFRGKTRGDRIDWILVQGGWEVRDASIDHFQREDRFPSDHFPVTAKLALTP